MKTGSSIIKTNQTEECFEEDKNAIIFYHLDSKNMAVTENPFERARLGEAFDNIKLIVKSDEKGKRIFSFKKRTVFRSDYRN